MLAKPLVPGFCLPAAAVASLCLLACASPLAAHKGTQPEANRRKATPEPSAGDACYVYLVNDNTQALISVFRAAKDGSLEPLKPVKAGKFPISLYAETRSRYFYSGDEAIPPHIYQYSIGKDGALTQLKPPAVTDIYIFGDIVQDKDPSVVYACGADRIYQFRIGPSGPLTPLAPPSALTSIKGVMGLAFSPDGRLAYALEHGEGDPSGYGANVQPFRVLPGGALRPLDPGGPVTVTMPRQVLFAPDGRCAYVAGETVIGGDFIGTGLRRLTVRPDGTYGDGGPAGVAMSDAAAFYLDTTSRLLFTPSGRWAVAVSEERDSGHEVLSALRRLPDDRLKQTWAGTLLPEGRVIGLDVPHGPRSADISDMAIDPVWHILYLVDKFQDEEAAVYAYRYTETDSSLRLSLLRVNHVGGLPSRIALVRPAPAKPSPAKPSPAKPTPARVRRRRG